MFREIMSCFVPEKQGQLKALGMTLAETVREYFKDEQHRKAFEIWHKQKYGQDYQWKREGSK